MTSRPAFKPLTFDGQTSWTVFKTHFDVVSSTNGWTDFLKASQLVASLRGSAAEVLQGIPADKLTDLTTIEKALESRFGDSHLTQFYRTELKARIQKPGKSLQLLAADVERLMSLEVRRVPSGCSGKIYVADITDPRILDLVFLQKFIFRVDLEKNEIRTGGEEIPQFSASVQHSKSCSVLAKERTILPARSECLIQGVPGQFRYAVTNFPSQASQKGVLVASTLVGFEMEAIPVRVLNLNNKPKILDKRHVIATCEPVMDIVTRPQEFSGAQHLPSTLGNFQIHNEEQRTAVRKLLNEFQNLFSTCDADVGHCNMTQHRINTEIKQYPRRLPLAMKEEAEHLVKETVDNGINEESSGPWASPIVLVKKKDGSTRFCVDYRRLNEITKKNSYPLPRIDDTHDILNGSQWFTTLDLKSGYWQVEVLPEDREKTAFTTGQGLRTLQRPNNI
ncbi:Transposon Ty3-I Gag-Pol polyprotein [Araneus ventricosus]|uniref:Transposon Ty3-I Gag-Pol polyprotein n=1 Tax=Araneus ventricosus TaxID=182803 RepID=A0A4Y2R761_ARAVE|nr:Transposon Ty3-I Gag-Pol polyprotein [Araneus ventricosus]